MSIHVHTLSADDIVGNSEPHTCNWTRIILQLLKHSYMKYGLCMFIFMYHVNVQM